MGKKLLLIAKDVGIFIGFWIISIIITVIFALNKITDYNLINLVAYIVCLALLFLIYHKSFKSFAIDFKNTYKKSLLKYIGIGIIGIILMNISSSIIANFIGKLPKNESMIRETLKGSTLIVMFLNIGVITPICEETIFRLNFRDLFKNKYIFIIFTGLLFGLVHLLASSETIEFFYIIPYSLMGIVLSYIYADSNNLFYSIIVHMLNNIGTLLLLLMVGI